MIEFAAGLMMGLAGAIHCVGMCGPLVAVMVHRRTSSGVVVTQLVYHIGRITTYLMMASIVAITTSMIEIHVASAWISRIAGVLMIAFAILQLLFHRNMLPLRYTSWVTTLSARMLARLRENETMAAMFSRGSLNGLLPCGLTMTALMASATLPAYWQVVLFIVGFGLGTSPGLVGLGAVAGMAGQQFRSALRITSPILVLAAGVIVLARSLSLDVSTHAAMKLQHKHQHQSGCCN